MKSLIRSFIGAAVLAVITTAFSQQMPPPNQYGPAYDFTGQIVQQVPDGYIVRNSVGVLFKIETMVPPSENKRRFGTLSGWCLFRGKGYPFRGSLIRSFSEITREEHDDWIRRRDAGELTSAVAAPAETTPTKPPLPDDFRLLNGKLVNAAIKAVTFSDFEVTDIQPLAILLTKVTTNSVVKTNTVPGAYLAKGTVLRVTSTASYVVSLEKEQVSVSQKNHTAVDGDQFHFWVKTVGLVSGQTKSAMRRVEIVSQPEITTYQITAALWITNHAYALPNQAIGSIITTRPFVIRSNIEPTTVTWFTDFGIPVQKP